MTAMISDSSHEARAEDDAAGLTAEGRCVRGRRRKEQKLIRELQPAVSAGDGPGGAGGRGAGLRSLDERPNEVAGLALARRGRPGAGFVDDAGGDGVDRIGPVSRARGPGQGVGAQRW